MKIITTVEALEREILTTFPAAEKRRVYNQLNEDMTSDKTMEVMVAICKAMNACADADPVSKAAMDTWTPLDRILWIVKEAYIRGVLNALAMEAEANAIGIKTIVERSRKA